MQFSVAPGGPLFWATFCSRGFLKKEFQDFSGNFNSVSVHPASHRHRASKRSYHESSHQDTDGFSFWVVALVLIVWLIKGAQAVRRHNQTQNRKDSGRPLTGPNSSKEAGPKKPPVALPPVILMAPYAKASTSQPSSLPESGSENRSERLPLPPTIHEDGPSQLLEKQVEALRTPEFFTELSKVPLPLRPDSSDLPKFSSLRAQPAVEGAVTLKDRRAGRLLWGRFNLGPYPGVRALQYSMSARLVLGRPLSLQKNKKS